METAGIGLWLRRQGDFDRGDTEVVMISGDGEICVKSGGSMGFDSLFFG